jgi:DAK2 domain fusion protein YloV
MATGWELVQTWAHHAVNSLGGARLEIDALNVYPVPDGDTGTNVYLTLEAARVEVDARCSDSNPTLGEVATAFARGALMGARGNSGVIMSQILRGACEVLKVSDEDLTGVTVTAMLRRGEELAYAAVAKPVEGTILTVARAAADAAESAAELGGETRDVIEAAAAAAHRALARTPELLPVLRDAGVVDAGGQSLTIVLDALRAAMAGEKRPDLVVIPNIPPQAHAPSVEYSGPAYEVMYLLDAEDIQGLRERLGALGDSLVIVGGDGLWNVHVHVDDVGAAIEAGIDVGRPHRIRVTHLRIAEPSTRHGRRIVAVTHGPGTAAVLASIDVVTVPAQAKQPPSTAALLTAMLDCGAEEVVLLPSDADVRAVADLAAEQARASGLRVSVVPTKSIVQTLAAAAVHDPSARFDEDVVSMTRAAGATRYAAVTTAHRSALTTAGPCEPGDILGLVDGDIVVLANTDMEAATRMLMAMLALGGELVTLVFGAEASADLRANLPIWIEQEFPFIELVTYDGGQPLWPVILGVE